MLASSQEISPKRAYETADFMIPPSLYLLLRISKPGYTSSCKVKILSSGQTSIVILTCHSRAIEALEIAKPVQKMTDL